MAAKKVKSIKKAVSKKVVASKKKAPAKTKVVKKKKVAPIPKGYHTVTPYMIIDGVLKAAEFYKKVFGAKVAFCMQPTPDGKVHHAEMMIGDSKIMMADEFPEMHAHGPAHYNGSPISIHLYVKNCDAVFALAQKAGAVVVKPLTNAFYGDRNGMFLDPFGYIWCVSTHIEDVSKAEMKKRMAKMKESGEGCC